VLLGYEFFRRSGNREGYLTPLQPHGIHTRCSFVGGHFFGDGLSAPLLEISTVISIDSNFHRNPSSLWARYASDVETAYARKINSTGGGISNQRLLGISE
jgi:hypothetical protein